MKNLVMMLLILSQLLTTSETNESNDPLLTIINTQEEFGTEITYWEIMIKEKMPSNQSYTELMSDTFQLRQGHQPGIEIYELTEKHNDITVSEQFVSPHEDAQFAERQIVISGTSFERETEKQYKQIISKYLGEIDIKNSRTYTCVKFIDDGTIENGLSLTQVASNLGVLHSKQQEEMIEQSLIKTEFYGYTPLWKQQFSMGGQPFNLHIAVIEKTNNQLEYVIGTPILMNEY